jgi:hypothetical protein
MSKKHSFLKGKIYRLYTVMAIIVLASASMAPLMLGREALAYGQITNRSLFISSGVPGQANVSYKFSFALASSFQVEGLKFIACTTAISTYPGLTSGCTPPSGFSAVGGGFSAVSYGSQTGWAGGTNFAIDATGANDCVPSGTNHNIICANRTDTTTETTGSSNIHTVTFSTIKNPTSTNTAFYVGVYTYTTNNYTSGSQKDFGATASAVVQTLETDAFVAEVLQFCVGSTSVDGVNTPVTDLIATDCSGGQGTPLSGTALNIGTLDTSSINISPVSTNGGDGKNGVAMVRSNAGNGVIIDYDAVQQSGTNHLGTLRISGASCDGTGASSGGFNPATNDFVDGCINGAGSTQNAFTAGTEEFGMTVAGVNSLGTTSYSCQYGDTAESVAAGNTCHLEPVSNYLGGGSSGTELYGTTNGFAWDETGAATTIASSAASSIKQVDDEALLLKFAATPSITTPFGRYAAQTDFIAVPTY